MLCASLLLFGSSLDAQQPGDPFGDTFFPPELVMQHQRAIGLTEEQKGFVVAEIQRAQARFTDLQWRLHGEMETMATLAHQDRADEAKILTQLDGVLNIEREIKRTHLTLIIRIRNRLTPEQRARLQEIRGRPGGR